MCHGFSVDAGIRNQAPRSKLLRHEMNVVTSRKYFAK